LFCVKACKKDFKGHIVEMLILIRATAGIVLLMRKWLCWYYSEDNIMLRL